MKQTMTDKEKIEQLQRHKKILRRALYATSDLLDLADSRKECKKANVEFTEAWQDVYGMYREDTDENAE